MKIDIETGDIGKNHNIKDLSNKNNIEINIKWHDAIIILTIIGMLCFLIKKIIEVKTLAALCYVLIILAIIALVAEYYNL